jgi:AAA+ superfamily predicted ATPase
MAIVVVLFSESIWKKVWFWIKFWKGKLTLKNIEYATYYKEILSQPNVGSIGIVMSLSHSLNLLLLKYIATNIPHFTNDQMFSYGGKGTPLLISIPGTYGLTDASTATFDNINAVICKSFQNLCVCPIYISENYGPLGICVRQSGSYFYFLNKRVVDEFREKVLTSDLYKDDVPVSKDTSCRFMEYDDPTNDPLRFKTSSFKIYQDRTFDSIVSKHKPQILRHLTCFQNTNKGKSMFNGFGSYNLGIIIYGEPGTGKTSFIKAICNYLGRNGSVKDLRETKTNENFKNMFKQRVNELVYIFEEFDCVQGVISREIDDSQTENKIEKRKKELNEKHIRLLSMLAAEDKDGKNISKEIDAVEKERKELANCLSLDTMLTVLDGPVEMRDRVIIACTNYIDRIDSALLRPGRFDMKIKLESFTVEETVELLEKMFAGDENLECIYGKKFKSHTPTNIINMCHEIGDLQGVVNALL